MTRREPSDAPAGSDAVRNLLVRTTPNWNDYRQAITTRYVGPTDRCGSRVKATAQAGSVTLDWDDALDSKDNHALAAIALAKKYKWLDHREPVLMAGGLPRNGGTVFVIVPREVTR